ncbi:MAG TPA: helix-turn-helix transcriptional regulator [Alphaproteobacteria bacterium]|jgi:DNA-binding CsgD family transcriptional regulator|nr:helix-turn-helix transcriptional regulator [Alphaproteobacteria bacterium]MDP6272095.1 helix-turn-helix transcriptional regulator [Alphaproteobacteria bacterium]MDP7429512.1 helix-turn-helix transcriptional regulator [Alphaproteobacteria bacterium]HJM51121.1 helix-turn-helix transcriptional regulator [Alphaproteobacteria bacterium]
MAGYGQGRRGNWRATVLLLALLVVAFCEVFLVIDVMADIFYIDIATPWLDHDIIELVAVVALGASLIVLSLELRRLLRERRRFEATLKAASGELFQVITAKFDDWGLTASERDIALLLIKGLALQEIADLRATRPGTVKSQSNAVYRKAGVSGRHELVAYFVEDLLAGEQLIVEPAQDA